MMTDAIIGQITTIEDLLAHNRGGHVEIIDGEVSTVPGAGMQHHLIIMNVLASLVRYNEAHSLGYIFPDGLIYLMGSTEPGLRHSFIPDLSLILHDSIIADFDIKKPYPGVPDFAVEVISPGDDTDDVQTKRRVYLEKGTQEVWLIYPGVRELHQHRRSDRSMVRIYAASGEAIGTSDLFPDWRITFDDVFALPPWARLT